MTPRATPLPPDVRRQAIIDATRPLIAQHGTRFTTKQVAEAAGIAEGTIFRVFPDKTALIVAVIDATLDPSKPIAALELLHEPTLDTQVSGILTILGEVFTQASGMFMTLATMHPKESAAWKAEHHAEHQATMAQRRQLLDDAIQTALTPYQAELRIPLAKLSTMISALVHMNAHSPATVLDVADLTDVLMNGASRKATA